MPFEPKLKNEILSELVARVVARSPLTDISEGSVMLTILGSVADELENVEYKLQVYRDSFSLEGAVGVDLDARCADFPSPGITRKGRIAASSAAMQITRSDSSTALLVPAGTRYALESNTDIIFIQDNDITMQIGDLTYPTVSDAPITVTCATPGTVGNVEPGTITIIDNAPGDIVSCTNTKSVGGGQDRETDEQLRQRAFKFLSSLARCQPTAIESHALQFTSGTQKSFLHAKLFEDPTRPGYSELVVDDGDGLQGFTQTGADVTGTVVGSSTIVIFHNFPATAEIGFGQLKKLDSSTGSYVDVPLKSDGSTPWVSIPERGLLYPDAGLFSDGDQWKITGYSVFTDPIRELQASIEGSLADPNSSPGFRAAGTRVRVLPPDVFFVSPVTLNIVVFEGVDTGAMQSLVKSAIVEFSRALRPGDPLLLSPLISDLMKINGLRNVTITALGSGSIVADVQASSLREVIRIAASDIEVI